MPFSTVTTLSQVRPGTAVRFYVQPKQAVATAAVGSKLLQRDDAPSLSISTLPNIEAVLLSEAARVKEHWDPRLLVSLPGLLRGLAARILKHWAPFRAHTVLNVKFTDEQTVKVWFSTQPSDAESYEQGGDVTLEEFNASDLLHTEGLHLGDTVVATRTNPHIAHLSSIEKSYLGKQAEIEPCDKVNWDAELHRVEEELFVQPGQESSVVALSAESDFRFKPRYFLPDRHSFGKEVAEYASSEASYQDSLDAIQLMHLADLDANKAAAAVLRELDATISEVTASLAQVERVRETFKSKKSVLQARLAELKTKKAALDAAERGQEGALLQYFLDNTSRVLQVTEQNLTDTKNEQEALVARLRDLQQSRETAHANYIAGMRGLQRPLARSRKIDVIVPAYSLSGDHSDRVEQQSVIPTALLKREAQYHEAYLAELSRLRKSLENGGGLPLSTSLQNMLQALKAKESKVYESVIKPILERYGYDGSAQLDDHTLFHLLADIEQALPASRRVQTAQVGARAFVSATASLRETYFEAHFGKVSFVSICMQRLTNWRQEALLEIHQAEVDALYQATKQEVLDAAYKEQRQAYEAAREALRTVLIQAAIQYWSEDKPRVKKFRAKFGHLLVDDIQLSKDDELTKADFSSNFDPFSALQRCTDACWTSTAIKSRSFEHILDGIKASRSLRTTLQYDAAAKQFSYVVPRTALQKRNAHITHFVHKRREEQQVLIGVVQEYREARVALDAVSKTIVDEQAGALALLQDAQGCQARASEHEQSYQLSEADSERLATLQGMMTDVQELQDLGDVYDLRGLPSQEELDTQVKVLLAAIRGPSGLITEEPEAVVADARRNGRAAVDSFIQAKGLILGKLNQQRQDLRVLEKMYKKLTLFLKVKFADSEDNLGAAITKLYGRIGKKLAARKPVDSDEVDKYRIFYVSVKAQLKNRVNRLKALHQWDDGQVVPTEGAIEKAEQQYIDALVAEYEQYNGRANEQFSSLLETERAELIAKAKAGELADAEETFKAKAAGIKTRLERLDAGVASVRGELISDDSHVFFTKQYSPEACFEMATEGRVPTVARMKEQAKAWLKAEKLVQTIQNKFGGADRQQAQYPDFCQRVQEDFELAKETGNLDAFRHALKAKQIAYLEKVQKLRMLVGSDDQFDVTINRDIDIVLAARSDWTLQLTQDELEARFERFESARAFQGIVREHLDLEAQAQFNETFGQYLTNKAIWEDQMGQFSKQLNLCKQMLATWIQMNTLRKVVLKDETVDVASWIPGGKNELLGYAAEQADKVRTSLFRTVYNGGRSDILSMHRTLAQRTKAYITKTETFFAVAAHKRLVFSEASIRSSSMILRALKRLVNRIFGKEKTKSQSALEKRTEGLVRDEEVREKHAPQTTNLYERLKAQSCAVTARRAEQAYTETMTSVRKLRAAT